MHEAHTSYQSDNYTLIRPDGHINGLDLDVGGVLVVRDYDGDSTRGMGPIPITVDQHLAMGPAARCGWCSRRTPGIRPSPSHRHPGHARRHAGTHLRRRRESRQPGRPHVRPLRLDRRQSHRRFAVSSPYAWDLSNLYTTGEVTLTAVPEPTSFALAAAGAFSLTFYRRRKIP